HRPSAVSQLHPGEDDPMAAPHLCCCCAKQVRGLPRRGATRHRGGGAMNILVELTSVTKIYDAADPHKALDGVSLSIPAGTMTAVMGPSGSGKSTLLNVVAGLDRASGGAIRVAGLDITRLGEGALARYRRTKVGLIFQFFNLLNNLTVL